MASKRIEVEAAAIKYNLSWSVILLNTCCILNWYHAIVKHTNIVHTEPLKCLHYFTCSATSLSTPVYYLLTVTHPSTNHAGVD